MKRSIVAATALALAMASGAASAADYNGTVSKEKVACIKLEHAKRLVDFYSTPDASQFQDVPLWGNGGGELRLLAKGWQAYGVTKRLRWRYRLGAAGSVPRS